MNAQKWNSPLYKNRLSSLAFPVLRQPCGPMAGLRVMLRQQECTLWTQSSRCFTFSQHKVNEGSWMLSSAMSMFQNKSLSHSYWITHCPFALKDLLVTIAAFPQEKTFSFYAAFYKQNSYFRVLQPRHKNTGKKHFHEEMKDHKPSRRQGQGF